MAGFAIVDQVPAALRADQDRKEILAQRHDFLVRRREAPRSWAAPCASRVVAATVEGVARACDEPDAMVSGGRSRIDEPSLAPARKQGQGVAPSRKTPMARYLARRRSTRSSEDRSSSFS